MSQRQMKHTGWLVIAAAIVLFWFSYSSHGLRNFDKADAIAASMVAELAAQTPPIPQSIPLSGRVATTSTASASLIAAQGASLRTYLYEISCANLSPAAAVLTIWDSPASGAAVPIASAKADLACAASGANSPNVRVFNPPIRMQANGTVIGVVTTTSGATVPNPVVNVYASGFAAR